MHMRKIFRNLFALALVMLGATTASADEQISLQDVPFTTWSAYGAEGSAGEPAGCAWVVGESTGLPYGDGSVINGADLSLYTKLIITYTEGTPRVMLNRDVKDGQWNSDETVSKLIEFPKDGGWSQKYFNNDTENGILTVDLKQILKDKGYVRLHAIKGANWANVTITSMIVERQGKAQVVGWTNIINNSNLEGDDVSSFAVAENAVQVEGVQEPTIQDGVGVNGSRGIALQTLSDATEDWATQLFVKLGEPLAEGTKWRFSMDVKADHSASEIGSGSHLAPREWQAGGIIPAFNVETDWTTVSAEGTIGSDLAGKVASIAFDLNKERDNANTFYFDNIKFEVYKYGTTVEYTADIIQIDFGFDTNLSELVKASNEPRLLFPLENVTVKVDGEEAEIFSVEGYPDGRFYIFMADQIDDDAEVLVSFTNPTDPAYHLIYTSGPGGDANSFTDLEATNNDEVAQDDVMSHDMLTPTVKKAEPEDGSFNLPNSIKDFKITFDKLVDVSKLVATMNGQALTVTPATGYAQEVTLTRKGDADLPTGTYIIKLTKIYPEVIITDNIFGEYEYTLNIGKVEFDPNDVITEILPGNFATCANGSIPEGYYVKFGEEDRPGGTSYGSGPRMFDFAEGGDFTKGLYFREGYVEFGSVDGYPLTLTAAKKYQISFNSAMWKDNGPQMRFEIFNEAQEQEYVQMISNKPNVNGSQAAVNGSTVTNITFIPEATGNYILRWTSATSETGNPGFNEVILANPSVKYIPNQVGLEETQLLNNALANAKSTRDGNTDERYAGEAYNTLAAAIEKYEAEMDTYTAPSSYKDAAAALDAASQALKDHRTMCDDYDNSIKQALDVVRNNAENKFAKTELYNQLVQTVAKYHGKSEVKNVAEDPEAVEEWETVYEYDKLTDDAALKEAVAELKDAANVATLFFTEGASATGNNGAKVLVERVRRGAETLKKLGAADDDALVVAAANAVSDDDELAEKIKLHTKELLYNQLKGENNLFEPVIDETTMESISPSYDMSAFFKNPNIYALKMSDGGNSNNVPGWEVTAGSGDITTMWTGAKENVEGVPNDVAFTKYHAVVRYEQTVTDLPAGVYTVVLDAASWADDDTSDSFVFAKTSDTPAVEEGNTEDRDVNFAATSPIEYYGQYVGHHDHELTDIVVTDGVLTVGAAFGPNSQFMFDQIKAINLTAPATGFDYAAAYTEVKEYIESGIEGAKAQPAKVNAIQLFDLNGQRIPAAKKGIVIVKKYMNDGTVRVEKVIRK